MCTGWDLCLHPGLCSHEPCWKRSLRRARRDVAPRPVCVPIHAEEAGKPGGRRESDRREQRTRSQSPSAKSCQTAALERAGLGPSAPPTPQPRPPPLPAAAAPAPEQSRADLGTRVGAHEVPPRLGHSVPVPLPLQEHGDSSRNSRGTPLAATHQHLCTPSSAQRLGWMWVEISPSSCD